MPSFDAAGLDARGRARVDAALAADPALADELELITSLLEEGAQVRFWRAFAGECERWDRPAGAVLAALERAAAGSAGRGATAARGAPRAGPGFWGRAP